METKILLIDDNPADAGVVKRLLDKVVGQAYSFVHETHPNAGLKLLGDRDIDCLILDYQLGSTTGDKVLRQIRDAGHDVAVVAYTGQGSEEVAVQSLKLGAQDYLVKGQVDSASLHNAIANATEKVSLQRKLREKEEELRAFVGTVSHDLRNPIRQMHRFAEILIEEATGLNDDCRSYLETIQKAGKRATKLIESLLEYTRVGRSARELVDVDLNEVMATVLQDFASRIEEAGATIEAQRLPTIQGDATALGQLLQNIIGNGIKYNESEKPIVRISASKQDNEWNISVADNGIGMEAKYLERIFRPLQRLHSHSSKYEGSGLGLASAEKIVKQHHGRIWVESTPNEGTTFFLAFPFANEILQSDGK